MKRVVVSLFMVAATALPQAADAARFNGDREEYAQCIATAASSFQVPPVVIKLLLDVEGGRPGMESPNTNGSFDLGPMQVNDRVWAKPVAAFGITRERLRDDTCTNIYVGTWIFMHELRRYNHLGTALANYHSKTPQHQKRYLGLLERAIERRLGGTTLTAMR
jgi:hypothetical protein